MELSRKAYADLLSWKEQSRGRTAILIEGARRTGKTTLAEKFGKEQYRSYVLVDLAKASKRTKDNFSDNLNDLDAFFQVISLEYNTELFRRETLVIFDEIQAFPKAREAVKYLVADGRYDILETGSLISIKENVEGIVIPSEEDKLRLYPLDFEEFAQACGQSLLYGYIRSCWENRTPLDGGFHRKAQSLLCEYLLVGGMPQSVAAYLENDKSFYAADREKRRILALYADDIGKADRRYRTKVGAIFAGIPGFLSSHEKRVKFAQAGSKNGADPYSDAVFWLGDSMICNPCYRCDDPGASLALARDDASVKCYLGDTGLLVSLAFTERQIRDDNLYNAIMTGKLALNKGMLHENLVAQMLVAGGYDLYFYTHYSEERHRNDIEVDFLLPGVGSSRFSVSPVEVKSSKNYSTTSYDAFRKRFGRRVGDSYVVHPKAFLQDAAGFCVPTYMFPCVLEERR